MRQQPLQVEVPDSPGDHGAQPGGPEQCDVAGQRLGDGVPVKFQGDEYLCGDDCRDQPRLLTELLTFPEKISQRNRNRF